MPAHKAEPLASEDPSSGVNLRVPCPTTLDEEFIQGLPTKLQYKVV